MSAKWRAIFVVPSIIVALGATFGAIRYLVDRLLGVPARLEMPCAVRCGGAVLLAIGLAILGWISKYRKPGDVLVSTYVSMRNSISKKSPKDPGERTEGLIFQGPQLYVRHPMYLAVVVMLLGWWLLLDYTLILPMAFFFFLWFNLVVIRFEEAELLALYGDQYAAYIEAVPKFFPSFPRRWP